MQMFEREKQTDDVREMGHPRQRGDNVIPGISKKLRGSRNHLQYLKQFDTCPVQRQGLRITEAQLANRSNPSAGRLVIPWINTDGNQAPVGGSRLPSVNHPLLGS